MATVSAEQDRESAKTREFSCALFYTRTAKLSKVVRTFFLLRTARSDPKARDERIGAYALRPGLERAANISVLILRSNVVEVSQSERGISLKNFVSCRKNTESNMAI
jgi:hypothetical protein